MPRGIRCVGSPANGRLSSVLLILALLLLPFPAAHAHLQNSTQIELRLVPGSSTAELEVAVDLTEAFGNARLYYEVSHGLNSDPALIRGVILDLAQAIEVESGGRSLAMTLEAFAWPDLPLVSFTEFWAAPMARFRFNIELAETGSVVQVRVAAGYPFPRPVAVTGIAHGNRTSRWVSPGVWQPVLSISPPDPQELSWAVPAPASQVAWHHLQEGFVHILPKGLDHILFVVALLLAIQSLRLAVGLITGFTLAHSITLALVASGSLNPPAHWVELAIAATILIVALVNFWRSPPGSHRLVVVTLFGLLHGMGFANALTQLGLPADDFWIALLTFNLGVELGQLVIVATFFLVFWRFRQQAWYRSWVTLPGSLGIAAMAALWMVQRW